MGPKRRKRWALLDEAGAKETLRLLAKLLGVVVEHGTEEVVTAVEEALKAGRFDLLGLCRAEQRDEVKVPVALAGYQVESGRAADSDVLLQEAAP